MLRHGNLDNVIFSIWCIISILIFCSIGSTPGFQMEGRMKEETKPCEDGKAVELLWLCRLIACCFSFSSDYVPKMNSFHKSSTVTSVPVKACQAFSPAGETTLENKTTVVVSPAFHVFFIPDPDRRETRMRSKKAATLHSVPRNYLIIIHPALVIHPVVINFAKGPCQLSTPLTTCRTVAETSPLSPHARQGKLTPHCSGDSKLQPVLRQLLLLVSAFQLQF